MCFYKKHDMITKVPMCTAVFNLEIETIFRLEKTSYVHTMVKG